MRGSRAAVVAVFAVLVAAYAGGRAASRVPAVQGDGWYTWLWARSLAFDADLDLTNDYALCGDPWGLTRWGEGELPPNQWPIGPALLWTPVAWVGRLLFPGHAGCTGAIPNMAMAGTVFAALAALWLGFRMARRHVEVGPSLLATLGVGLASPLAYYTIYVPSYSHAPAAFGAALFLERWEATRGQRALGRWMLLGALLALAMLMRPQLAILVIAPLLEWIGLAAGDLRAREPRRLGRHVGAGALFTLAVVAGFAPQLALTNAMYGSPFAVPQGPHYMRWSEAELLGPLFGTTGGLLFWTPFLYLSVVGWVGGAFRRGTRAVSGTLVLIFVVALYVNGAVWDWWGSAGFSNRRFTFLAAPFVLGAAVTLAPVFRWAERRPRQAAAAFSTAGLLVLVGWNFAAMAGVVTGRIDSWREQPADLAWRGVFREAATQVHRHVGNPLAWPASIPFALRYDVHPRHWDAMQGMAIMYLNYEDRAPRIGEETVRFEKRLHQEYLVEGFEVKKVRGATAAVARGERGRMLVPLFAGEAEGVIVRWRALEGRAPSRATVSWNGRALAHADVPARRWRSLRIALPAGRARPGVNELEWRFDGEVAIQSLEMVPGRWLPPGLRFGEPRPGAPRPRPRPRRGDERR
ncbi:MAG: hypothetical protein ACODAU_06690 [Myxococcota bacterium]